MRIGLGAELIFLQSGRHHTHSQGFAQNQTVTGFGLRIFFQILWVHETQSHQSINGLNAVDGVPSGQDHASVLAHRLAPAQNVSNGLCIQGVHWHGHNGQGQNGLSSHGVDVAQGIGCCDATKLKRVVHDGHEEIGGRHQSLVLVDLIHRCVVGGFHPHQELLGDGQGVARALSASQNILQHRRCNLATTPTAMRE